MKTLRLALAILSVAVPAVGSLAINVHGARAADAGCECFCAPVSQETIYVSATSGPGVPGSTSKLVDVPGKKFDSGSVTDENACKEQCAKTAPGEGFDKVVFDSCVKAACWCKGVQGNYVKGETSQQGCKDACASVSHPFVSWGNTPPPSAGDTATKKCPPGGIWTPDECAAAKNSEGAKIGVWKGPSGIKEGPYCFYNDIPIKLGVGLGTVTSANLSQYLSAAYRLGLGIAAALAVIFIMIGGFRYLSAAGGAGVEEGKSMIKNAIIGLILAALSYTLLLTVNPDILSLRLPTIQLIKQCATTVPIDCGSRKDKATCDDNSKDPSKKCSWNNMQSICEDFAITQSATPGQLGGECKKEPNGTYSCAAGRCVVISNPGNMRCSTGGPCEACTSDSSTDPVGPPGQCRPDPGGYPVKCIDNKCARVNPNNPPKSGATPSKDNYILCTGASGCSSDDQCATGKCVKGQCLISNQGSECLSKGDDMCTKDSKCISFDRPRGLFKACCLNGDKENCLGCSTTDNILESSGKITNTGCPKNMICSPEEKCVTGQ